MKKPALFRKIGWLLVILTFLAVPNLANAYFAVFNDEFLSVDEGNWTVNRNGGIVDIQDQSLHLHSETGTDYPYVIYNGASIPSDEYTIEIRFKFHGNLNYGDGIVFSNNLIENGTLSDIGPNDVIFQVWPTNNTTFALWTTLCQINSIDCVEGSYTRIVSFLTDTWHKIKIHRVNDSTYAIFFDDEMIFQTRQSLRNISKIWFGNPQHTKTDTEKADIFIDYFNVFQDAVVEKNSVVVIPGFGGSWDIGAILAGGQGHDWKVPSFVKNYDTVVSSLENTGLVMDSDLFVFSYDWRKPLNNLADDLNTFIESKNLAGKVDMIGHSMGGLVARAYAQKYGVTKIDKILTVGTPNMGVTDLYGLWEGAKIWEGSAWWQNVLLEIATEVNRLPGETKVAAIRRVSPSILDLFPTYSFLNMNGVDKPLTTMNQQNLYLKNLNSDTTVLTDKLIPFWSEDISSTRKKIKVTTRTMADVLEQRWEDGSPINVNPYEVTGGDGTVTKESAVGSFGDGQKLAGWHGDLLSNQDNLSKIFQTLGLDTTKITAPVQTDVRKHSFVAILRSPGTLEVCDPLLINCNDQLGLYFPEFKLFILPGYEGEDLKVRVKEFGLGSYKLHLGNIDESPDWVVRDGNLKNVGQIDSYEVRRNGENIFVYPQLINKDQCKKDGWKIFDYLGFKNQGLCVSYLESLGSKSMVF